MFDAAGVRRAAGHQAKILNLMIDELFKHHKLRHIHLKELLGHTRKEVFAGMIVGIAVAWALTFCWSRAPRTFRCPAPPHQDAAAATAPARP